MANDAPLYFQPRLGMLKPANRAAEEALAGLSGTVTVKITGGKANQRRRSLFWVLAGIVTPILNDMHDMTLTDDDLHEIMRIKFGMFDEITLPSGEVHRKLWSTSNRAMSEPDRTKYLNRCLDVWSKWTGIDVATLTSEGQQAA